MRNDLMRRLAGRRFLSGKFGLRYHDGSWPYLDVRDPAGVARLVGEAKLGGTPDQRVFLRGQVRHYSAMLPSLLRGRGGNPETLKQAERALGERICTTIPVKRFNTGDVASLLQHYGFRTSWLDAVDNLFVAVWFATHELRIAADYFLEMLPSSETHGWLYLLASTVDAKRLRSVDLRTEHHPLSARPHVQHGISLARIEAEEQDFRDFVIATVRFPIARYTTTGTLFDDAFLLPPIEADHTLRLLLKHRANALAAEVEAQYELPDGTLGRVAQLRLA